MSSCNANKIDNLIESKYIKHIDISISKSKKWAKNYFNVLRSPGELILEKYKNKFDADIEVLFDNNIVCYFPAKIRISGDYKDHVSGTPLITSVDIKLLTGNVNSIVKFKLFIPHTRDGDNEIFTSAFMKELGFLAPITYYVPAKLNGQSTTFMFQEKIVKEFIEANNLREAPILEGDERFAFSDKKTFNDKFILARVVNKNWAKKGLTSLNISKIALARLNTAYVNYMLSQHIHETNIPKFFNPIDTGRNKEFKAIMLAIGAGHGLHPGDRKFYYDPIYRIFRPIYYDGNSTITKLKNTLDEFMHLGNKLYFLRGNPGLTNNEIIGVESALKSLKKINIGRFYSNLKKLNLEYSLEDVQTIVKKIIGNLKVMGASTTQQSERQYSPYFSHYKDLEPNKKLVFTTKKDLHIEICNLSLSSCHYDILSINKYAKLLQGRYSDNSNNDYIFIGNKQNYITGLSIPMDEKLKVFKVTNNVKLIAFGRPNVIINKKDKKINLHQNDSNDRILIKGGKLKDWSIKLTGSTDKKGSNAQRYNQDLLTGCLTLIDISLDNVDIEASQALCEDSVNLMRAKGSINNMTINNALSDAIDVDFSKVDFKNIKVTNAGNDCVDLSSGDYSIQNADLSNCKDKAISVGESSKLSVDFVKVSNSTAGVVAKDSSIVKVNTVVANDVTTCFSAYNKKQEFWGGKITIGKHNCRPNQFFIQDGSLINFANEF
jgi:hypothetical protein